MKNLWFISFVLIMGLSGCCSGESGKDKSAESKAPCCVEAKKQLRHVVMFGFKPELTPVQVKEIEEAFAALPSKIDQVKGYEWGTNCSPEPFANGLTHCFTLSFDSDEDRDAYLVHPAHKEFGALVDGKLSGITVLDYWAQ